MTDMEEPQEVNRQASVRTSGLDAPSRTAKMKRYRDWPALPLFLSDCKKAAETDVLVTPPVAAAILGYSRVRMTRLLDQEEIVSWAWYEPNKFHASEIFVSVRSLVVFGLRRGRLGSYDTELPLQAVIDQALYEKLRQEILT